MTCERASDEEKPRNVICRGIFTRSPPLTFEASRAAHPAAGRSNVGRPREVKARSASDIPQTVWAQALLLLAQGLHHQLRHHPGEGVEERLVLTALEPLGD